MILLIDNYDSFTYNLVQYLGELGGDCRIYRNDHIDLPEIERLRPDRMVISPGPCTPRDAGISEEAILAMQGRIPLLGVCLGHQCIGFCWGAEIPRAKRLMHGKTSEIHHDGKTIFEGLTNPFTATRYHSLTIDRDTLGKDFEITAWTDRDELMGIRHKTMPVEGVQFHPESFLTTEGPRLLDNFLKL